MVYTLSQLYLEQLIPGCLVAEQAVSEKWRELLSVTHHTIICQTMPCAPLSPILQPPRYLHELDTWVRKPGLCTWALVLRAWRETCGNQQSWQAFWRRQVLLEMDLPRGGRKNHGDGGGLLSLFWEFGIELTVEDILNSQLASKGRRLPGQVVSSRSQELTRAPVD